MTIPLLHVYEMQVLSVEPFQQCPLHCRLICLLDANGDDLLAYLGLSPTDSANIDITAAVGKPDAVTALMGSYARYNCMIVACRDDQFQSNYDGNVGALACLDTLATCESLTAFIRVTRSTGGEGVRFLSGNTFRMILL